VARLGDPVVGAQVQAAHPLGDGRGTRADDDAELGQRFAQALEPAPGLRPQYREIDHQGAEAHRDDRLGGDWPLEHAVLPSESIEPLAEDLDEAAVAVEDRYPQ
jgi:hypothetical protein